MRRTAPVLERNYLARAAWQRWRLGRLAAIDGCALLFVPGGSFATRFRPVVTMSRNMLPFEPAEARRYGLSAYRLKLMLLRLAQARSLRIADGRIFLTRYAHDTILHDLGVLPGRTGIIPHGVDERFKRPPRVQRHISDCSTAAPFRLLYVSTIDTYKHQDTVARAVTQLRAEGLPVVLDLVGGAYPPALASLRGLLQSLDPQSSFLRYQGLVPYSLLHEHYAKADAGVFASSCENMPNTLLEKMASALPLACARRGPMPEVLGAAGMYFDPESVVETTAALREMILDIGWREQAARAAADRACTYTWQRCADETFVFLQRIAVESSAETGNSR